MINRVKEFLIGPFRLPSGEISRLLLALFILLNGIVLFNAAFHHPFVGYDSFGHIKYMEILSGFRLPAWTDTHEFFNPPLSYVLPAALHSMLAMLGTSSPAIAAKFSQFLNFLYSCFLTIYLIRICDIIRPGNVYFKAATMAFLGMLPVYYKTFAFVRPEPLLAFLSVFAVYKTLAVFFQDDRGPRSVIALGISLGFLIITRQWGFFIFPAVFIFAAVLMIRNKSRRSHIVKTVLVSFSIAFLVGGWYYLHLYREYGDIKAFNMSAERGFSFSNQPVTFYTGLGSGKIFSDPVRKSFPNQLLPIFYSETWGDYWCYFLVKGWDARSHFYVSGLGLDKALARTPLPWWLTTNRYDIAAYLGRINFVSLIPSAVLLASFILGTVYFLQSVTGRPPDEGIEKFSLPYLFIVSSVVGYLWFLISYPVPSKGDTIKASYMLQIFPFISLLAGELILKIKQRYRRACIAIVIVLAISFLHNFPAFITRYYNFLK